jgi:hypothetical protein
MSTQKVAIKHLHLFIAGALSFQIEGFDNPEIFPNLSDKILSTDMNSVKQFIEKNWLPQGFKAFLEIAKANFGLEPTDKLTPQMWADAVTSYKVGKGSVALQVDANENEELDPKRSYVSAMALANTLTQFAKHLEPEYFSTAETLEDFIALLPAAVEEIQAAVETAQETPVIETAPEQEVPAAPIVVAKDAKPATAPVQETAVVATAEAPETGIVAIGLKHVVEAFDAQDRVLEAAEDRFNLLATQITDARKATIQEIRAANKGVRAAMLTAITGEVTEEVGQLETNV